MARQCFLCKNVVFVKVIVEAETNRILGAQMMCARATDMISQFTQAIANKMTLADMKKVI